MTHLGRLLFRWGSVTPTPFVSAFWRGTETIESFRGSESIDASRGVFTLDRWRGEEEI